MFTIMCNSNQFICDAITKQLGKGKKFFKILVKGVLV